MDEQQILNLLKCAKEISDNAYAPYSKFSVGCAVLLKDGGVITGVNVENASFSVTICAERVALAQVVTLKKQRLIKAIAIVTQSSPVGFPCGACRQFIEEIVPTDIPIIVGNHADEWLATNILDLLPHPFNKKSLP